MSDRRENQISDAPGAWRNAANAVTADTALPPALAGAERVVVWPHRSLGREGTLAVMSVAAVGFAVVTAWVAAPAAWFVVVPAIIAFASLALAFWLNMRRAERLEIIDVSANLVRVTTSYLGHHHLVDRFNPAWVHVEVSDDYKIEKRLILRESGRAVSIGDCLSPQEREDLAAALREKIRRAREGLG